MRFGQSSHPVSVEDFVYPVGLRSRAVAMIKLHQLRPCSHGLEIRDRTAEGAPGARQYWIQLEPVTHGCTAKYLLPIVTTILRESYPARPATDLEGTIILRKEAAPLPDLVQLLVRELAPYLNTTLLTAIYQHQSPPYGTETTLPEAHLRTWR